MVRRVLVEGHSYADAAEGFAGSVRTVAKWVRRFREGGVVPLEDGSSRPGAPPHQTSRNCSRPGISSSPIWRSTHRRRRVAGGRVRVRGSLAFRGAAGR